MGDKKQLYCSSWVFLLISLLLSQVFASQIVFRDGLNGYSGTEDTAIQKPWDGPTWDEYNFGKNLHLTCYGTINAADRRLSLIRFTDLIGGGPNKIPPGSVITSAYMELFITHLHWSSSGKKIRAHKMLTPWVEGNQASGIEQGATTLKYRYYDTTYWGDGSVATNGPVADIDYETAYVEGAWEPIEGYRCSLDVTSFVRDWVAEPDKNYGVFLQSSTWDSGPYLFSSEYEELQKRPRLVVNYSVLPDEERSTVSVSHVARPAGGEKYPITVKVKLANVNGEPMFDRKIALKKESGIIPNIVPINGGITDKQGVATFIITSTVVGNITLYPSIDLGGGLSIIDFKDEKSIIRIDFSQAISMQNSSLKIIGNGTFEADGINLYDVILNLFDYESNPINNRKVCGVSSSFFEIIPDNTITGEISPGKAFFKVKAKQNNYPIKKMLSLQVEPDEEEANHVIFEEKVIFIGQVVTTLIPEADSTTASVTAPLKIIFTHPIQAIAESTKFTLSEDSNGVVVSDIYDGEDDSNWSILGNELTWSHGIKLRFNTLYAVRLENIKDINSGTFQTIEWKFMAIDEVKPTVLEVVYPKPWAIDIETQIEVQVIFSEPLEVDNTNKPVSLNIIAYDQNGVQLNYNRITNILFDSLTNQLSFVCELDKSSVYTITLDGALDFAGNCMIPYTWSFSTKTTADQQFKVVQIDSDINSKGYTRINSDIRIYFNKYLEPSQVPSVIIRDKISGQNVAGTTYFISIENGLGYNLVFTPNILLEYGSAYEIIEINIKDEVGNELVFTRPMEFYTEVRASDLYNIKDGTNIINLPINREDSINIQIEPQLKLISSEIQVMVSNVHDREKEILSQKIYNDSLSLTAHVYDFEFQENGNKLNKLDRPMVISLPYFNSIEGELNIFYWDPTKEDWISMGGEINPLSKTVSFVANKSGIYGIMMVSGAPESILSEVGLTANPISYCSRSGRFETTIVFRLACESRVSISLYDNRGRLVSKLQEEVIYPPGYNGFNWDGYILGQRIRPGIYIYHIFVTSLDSSRLGNEWVTGTLGVIQ